MAAHLSVQKGRKGPDFENQLLGFASDVTGCLEEVTSRRRAGLIVGGQHTSRWFRVPPQRPTPLELGASWSERSGRSHVPLVSPACSPPRNVSVSQFQVKYSPQWHAETTIVVRGMFAKRLENHCDRDSGFIRALNVLSHGGDR